MLLKHGIVLLQQQSLIVGEKPELFLLKIMNPLTKGWMQLA